MSSSGLCPAMTQQLRASQLRPDITETGTGRQHPSTDNQEKQRTSAGAQDRLNAFKRGGFGEELGWWTRRGP